MNHEEDYRRGRELMDRLHGGRAGERLVANLADVCPDFATMTLEWAMAGVMARPGLDLLTREFLLIASCVTLGHVVPQLGASKEQVIEVILQMLFYAGGAATANALGAAKRVFERAAEGAHDVPAKG